MLIRNYCDPEPTWGDSGSEETAGWTHDFLGVSNASIGDVMGVAKANIGNVSGVA